jgi:hypothetical protein
MKKKGREISKVSFIVLMLGAMLFCSKLGFGQPLNHGFRLIEKRFVKEINAECYLFEHVKSGAHLFKVSNNDENKTFGITFRTLPGTDNGVAHILEHSVLNGSKNFPVKSPFDILSKGSLNTFLNAMTSRDVTEYPFASMNDKDYFNLMHIYLDAVLNPLIYSDTRILKQEGWHYELTSKEAPITYKGVVYNEMKGSFSNPQRELFFQNLKSLFPDNVYGKESGGLPSSIVTLTQQQFVAFHKKFYHPENSFIFLYGNASLDKELEFIDSKYLSNYTRTTNNLTIVNQKPFLAMKEVSAYYPIMEGASSADQTFLALNFATGESTDYALGIALNVLCEVLVNQESAPIRIALQNAGVGQDVSAYVQDYKQNILTISVQNANPTDKAKFKTIVFNTLRDIVKKGIDKREIQAVLNRIEFDLREGSDAQKGITYMSLIKSGWLFAGNPFKGLEYEKSLTAVKNGLKTNYYEMLVQKYILNNRHCSYVVLEPKPGLDKERNDKTEKELQVYKSKLTSAQIDSLVKQTNDLIAFQNSEDTPEQVAKIPMLSISDINPKPSFFACEEKQLNGMKVLHHSEYANNIIYSNLLFDLRTLPQDLIPYASLLANISGMMSTQNYSFGDLNRELNSNTGGFSTSLVTYLENNDDSKLLPYFMVTSKVVKEKCAKMFDLSLEVILKSNLSDTSRLKDVLTRHQAQLEASMNSDGYNVASGRIASYFSNQGVFDEQTAGLDYYWFITSLVKDFDKNATQICTNLKKVANLLFVKENMISAVTCSNEDYPIYIKSLDVCLKKLPLAKPEYNTWTFKLENKNEGILTASKVQYVIQGFDMKKLGYKWDGKMRVLSQILSTDWLKNQVRVIGGAYGGFSSFSPTGYVTFSSYRDPNLASTLEIYKKTFDYLSKFEASTIDMTRYIIGTISELDAPMTIQQRGQTAFRYYFSKRTENDLQTDRTAILNTTPADIKKKKKMVAEIMAQQSFCVYGNTDKIQKEKEGFKKLIKIEVE